MALLMALVCAVCAACNLDLSQPADASKGPASPSPSATPSPSTTPSTPEVKQRPAASTGPRTTATTASPPRGTALVALAGVPVKGRAQMNDYDRDQFGQAWLDTDRNGCDTRNDVLARALTGKQTRPGTNGCVVEAGRLADLYTGAAIAFVRGPGDLVDIDHVVPLGNAWVTGARSWPARKRAAFANDPIELLAVDASANRQKGDGDAATWLPPNKAFRCDYVARQVAVKLKYGLWMTPPEKAAIGRILATCPEQRLPADSGAPVISPVAPNAPQHTPEHHPRSTTTQGDHVWFENCDAARAAGAAPVTRGEPGYDRHLDRDGDGVGCDA